jgi:hypothetical protein
MNRDEVLWRRTVALKGLLSRPKQEAYESLLWEDKEDARKFSQRLCHHLSSIGILDLRVVSKLRHIGDLRLSGRR